MNRYDLISVWRDPDLLSTIRSEVARRAKENWIPWTLKLPAEVLWPMLNEISSGMASAWSPCLDNVPVDVSPDGKVEIDFVLKGMTTSPVMTKSMQYSPRRKDDVGEIEVRRGAQVRV